jgi:ketosteroid isomerase-like protein
MDTTVTSTNPDIDRLSTGFHRCFETFAAGDDLFADDAFFDLLPPLWRFQLVGGTAFTEQLRAIAEGPVHVEVVRTIPTASGFVTEHVEHMDVDGAEMVARRLWLCEVRDGRIVDVTGYCNGGWDAELRARHAAEAPMLRA